jgi:hypothetical protein
MLKNMKVASTSLEVELSKVLPNNAIVTEINPKNDQHVPRNNEGFFHHMPYSMIEKSIDLSDVKSYVFVRHPYDIQISMLFYRLKQRNIDWEKIDDRERDKLLDVFFLQKDIDFEMQKSTKYIYTKNDKIVVDDILRYENGIDNEINPVLSRHNIKNITMNTFEKDYRPKKYTAQNVFKEKHLHQIYKEWKWEFEQFGYTS